MLDFFLCNIYIYYDSKISHFVYFLPSGTGVICIQLSADHAHIQCLILINEGNNL